MASAFPAGEQADWPDSPLGVTRGDDGIGIVASFAVGLAAIAFLLRYLAARPLYIFVWYRLALAAIVVIVVVG